MPLLLVQNAEVGEVEDVQTSSQSWHPLSLDVVPSGHPVFSALIYVTPSFSGTYFHWVCGAQDQTTPGKSSPWSSVTFNHLISVIKHPL